MCVRCFVILILHMRAKLWDISWTNQYVVGSYFSVTFLCGHVADSFHAALTFEIQIANNMNNAAIEHVFWWKDVAFVLSNITERAVAP